jgi:hypothetical protein
MWPEIQPFQTLIVGIIGFSGVMATLLFNASQARRQREEERKHESRALRTALIEELGIIRESVAKNLEDIDASRDGYVPTDPMDDAYRAFTHRIGALSEKEVRCVLYAYLTLRTYNSKLFLIGNPVGTGDRHVMVPAKNSSILSGMYKNLLPPLDEAINAMKLSRDE